jgi:MFS family permease
MTSPPTPIEQAPSSSTVQLQTVRRNVWLLAFSQAIKLSQMTAIFTVTGLVGAQIAPSRTLATLPISLQLLATMMVTPSGGWWIARYGARLCFLLAALVGVVGAGIATWSVQRGHFVGLCLALTLMGVFNGISNFYRFVAADQSPPEYKARAISYVLGGGVLASFVGPNLARLASGWLERGAFAGSFLAVLIVSVVGLPALAMLRLPSVPQENRRGGRPLSEIARQPKLIVAVLCGLFGFCIMNFLMIATPFAMADHHHSFADTASVIQWHVFAMFAPAFFTGSLIKRFGVGTVMLAGAVANGACVALNLSGTSLVHYLVALFLLGIGWNFLYIGATTLVTEVYRPDERAKVQGANELVVSAGVALSAFFAGSVHQRWGWQVTNLAVLPGLAIILISLLWLRIRRQEERGG